MFTKKTPFLTKTTNSILTDIIEKGNAEQNHRAHV